MAKNAAANAVLAKARAKYGKFVVATNYEALCNCQSVADVVAYLKQHTGYAAALSNLSAATVHRGNLEKLMHLEIRNQVNELCSFLKFVGCNSFDFIGIISQCRLILNYTRLLLADNRKEFFENLNEKSNEKLYAGLLEAHSLSDVGKLLQQTVFFKDAPLFENELVKFDFPLVEAHLYKTAFEFGRKEFIKNYSGQERREALGLLEYYTEIKDLQMIYRCLKLKPVDSLPPERLLIGYRDGARKKHFEKLLNAKSEQEFIDILNSGVYKNIKDEIQNLPLGIALAKRLRKRCAAAFHFSKFPSVGLLSFILIMECEYSDLATVIEGVRYGCTPDTIKEMLIA